MNFPIIGITIELWGGFEVYCSSIDATPLPRNSFCL
jgi:hypothetical protein